MPQTVKDCPKQLGEDRPKRDEEFHRRLQESADKYTSTPLPQALRSIGRTLAWLNPLKRRKSTTSARVER